MCTTRCGATAIVACVLDLPSPPCHPPTHTLRSIMACAAVCLSVHSVKQLSVSACPHNMQCVVTAPTCNCHCNCACLRFGLFLGGCQQHNLCHPTLTGCGLCSVCQGWVLRSVLGASVGVAWGVRHTLWGHRLLHVFQRLRVGLSLGAPTAQF